MKTKQPNLVYCDHCDGTGEYEGGPKYLLTKCEKCNGKGVLKVKKVNAKKETSK